MLAISWPDAILASTLSLCITFIILVIIGAATSKDR